MQSLGLRQKRFGFFGWALLVLMALNWTPVMALPAKTSLSLDQCSPLLEKSDTPPIDANGPEMALIQKWILRASKNQWSLVPIRPDHFKADQMSADHLTSEQMRADQIVTDRSHSGRNNLERAWELTLQGGASDPASGFHWIIRQSPEIHSPSVVRLDSRIELLLPAPSGWKSPGSTLGPQNQFLPFSHSELQPLFKSWLVGHPLHPYGGSQRKKQSLKKFQIDTIQVFNEFRRRGEKRLLLVSPGGTGKTEVFKQIFINKNNEPNQTPGLTVLLVDQRIGLRQMEQEFKALTDSVVVWGDGEEAKGWAEVLSPKKNQILISTVQTFKRRWAEADGSSKIKVLSQMDLMMYDEAHHLGALGIQSTLKEMEDLMPLGQGPFLFGATASPLHQYTDLFEVFNGRVFWAYFDSAREFLEAKRTTQRSTRELMVQLFRAIQAGEITPIDQMLVYTNLQFETHDSPLFLYDEEEEHGRRVLNPLYYPVVFSKIEHLLKNTRSGFINAATIVEAERFVSYLKQVHPEIQVQVLHSKLPREQIHQTVEALRTGEIQFAVTVKMFDESVNIPELSTYIDLTMSSSVRQMVQRMSRVTRLADQKLAANIVLMWQIDEDSVGEAFEFLNLNQLGKSYVRSDASKRNNGSLKLKDQNHLFLKGNDLEFAGPQWDTLRLAVHEFWSQQVPSQQRKRFSVRLQELEAFIKKNQRLPKLSSEQYEEKSLAQFLNRTKVEVDPDWWNLLQEDTLELVKALGLDRQFKKTPSARQEELGLFVRTHRRLPRSKALLDMEEASLGVWLSSFKNRDPESWWKKLDEETQLLLEELNLKGALKTATSTRLMQMSQFVILNKRWPTINSKEESEVSLARWYQNYRHQEGEDWWKALDSKAQAVIKQTGLHLPSLKTRDQRLQDLMTFLETHGRRPRATSPDRVERALGAWLNNTKRLAPEFLKNHLDADFQKLIGL